MGAASCLLHHPRGGTAPRPRPRMACQAAVWSTQQHTHTYEYYPDAYTGQLQHQRCPSRPPDATPDTHPANCVHHSNSWPTMGQVRGWLQGCLLSCMTHATQLAAASQSEDGTAWEGRAHHFYFYYYCTSDLPTQRA